MRKHILVAGVLSSWVTSIIYYQVEEMTGYAFKPLIVLAVIMMVLGLFLGCRESKETTRREA